MWTKTGKQVNVARETQMPLSWLLQGTFKTFIQNLQQLILSILKKPLVLLTAKAMAPSLVASLTQHSTGMTVSAQQTLPARSLNPVPVFDNSSVQRGRLLWKGRPATPTTFPLWGSKCQRKRRSFKTSHGQRPSSSRLVPKPCKKKGSEYKEELWGSVRGFIFILKCDEMLKKLVLFKTFLTPASTVALNHLVA